MRKRVSYPEVYVYPESLIIFTFLFYLFLINLFLHSIKNHIMRTKCPIDMKQMALEREFHKLPILASAHFRLLLS